MLNWSTYFRKFKVCYKTITFYYKEVGFSSPVNIRVVNSILYSTLDKALITIVKFVSDSLVISSAYFGFLHQWTDCNNVTTILLNKAWNPIHQTLLFMFCLIYIRHIWIKIIMLNLDLDTVSSRNDSLPREIIETENCET